MKPLILNLALTGLWVLITGDASFGNALAGFAVGFALLLWLWPQAAGRRYFRKLPQCVGFALYFLWQLTKSSLQVAREVITPRPHRKPAILRVPLAARTDAELTLLMNLVTLTPGTVVVGHDSSRREMWVHAMFAHQPDHVRREIKEGFERRVLELLR
jgi:multicomponent Na+:H+ antiporter subunit E